MALNLHVRFLFLMGQKKHLICVLTRYGKTYLKCRQFWQILYCLHFLNGKKATREGAAASALRGCGHAHGVAREPNQAGEGWIL